MFRSWARRKKIREKIKVAKIPRTKIPKYGMNETSVISNKSKTLLQLRAMIWFLLDITEWQITWGRDLVYSSREKIASLKQILNSSSILLLEAILSHDLSSKILPQGIRHSVISNKSKTLLCFGQWSDFHLILLNNKLLEEEI